LAGNSRALFVRAAATKLLKAADVSGPPVPIVQLITDQGLAITSGNIPDGWGYFDPGAWAIRLSNSILVETAATRNRRRFTLAHELGHCLLEHGEQPCWNLGSVPEPADLGQLDDFPDFEQEAHLFARELLLPREWFRRDWLVSQDVTHWVGVYGVAKETLFIVLAERRLLMSHPKKRR
jgi:Zn-dependent peptidase ImmA (M78 family)